MTKADKEAPVKIEVEDRSERVKAFDEIKLIDDADAPDDYKEFKEELDRLCRSRPVPMLLNALITQIGDVAEHAGCLEDVPRVMAQYIRLRLEQERANQD